MPRRLYLFSLLKCYYFSILQNGREIKRFGRGNKRFGRGNKGFGGENKGFGWENKRLGEKTRGQPFWEVHVNCTAVDHVLPLNLGQWNHFPSRLNVQRRVVRLRFYQDWCCKSSDYPKCLYERGSTKEIIQCWNGPDIWTGCKFFYCEITCINANILQYWVSEPSWDQRLSWLHLPQALSLIRFTKCTSVVSFSQIWKASFHVTLLIIGILALKTQQTLPSKRVPNSLNKKFG